ncbi:MAG: hypothetical protein AAFQ80_17670 [Cyanobacteria bacterium J06621_8]
MKSSKTIETIRKYLVQLNQRKEKKTASINPNKIKVNKLKQLSQELYSVSYQSMGQLIHPAAERDRVEQSMDGKEEIPDEYLNQISELATLVQVKILDAVDTITKKGKKRVYLVDHINDWTLEDYEPEQYSIFRNSELHCSFIIKLRTALKKIGREVYLTRFDYKDYDSWLNITGLKNSPESIELWAKKRHEEGINSFGETPDEEEKRTRETIAPLVDHIIKERIARGEILKS